MKTKANLLILLLSLSVALFGQQVHVKIIQSSDVHGAIFPFDYIRKVPAEGSLARVSNYVKAQRQNKAQHCILIDNGDILQGDPAVYFYNSPDSASNLMARVMNYLQYDLINMGNHDIEQGHAVYDRFVSEISFPALSANTLISGTDSCYFKPYVVKEVQGIRIVFLGLITPAIPMWLPEQLYSGMSFEDMIKSARFWVKYIHEREKVDLMVGVFHAGVDFTYGGQSENTPYNENASELVAKQVAGFDLIFVGHDHHGWNKSVSGPDGNEVWILGPTSKARNLAVADIDFDKNKSISKITTDIVSMKQIEPDPDFVKYFANEEELLSLKLNEPICTLGTDLVSREALFGNSAFVDLIHAVQLDYSKAQVSFASSNAFNQIIAQGNFTFADLFKLYKYENTLYTIKLKGSEIKDYLEYSYSNWFEQLRPESNHLLRFKVDQNGEIQRRNSQPQLAVPFYNFDCAAGIQYEVHLDKPMGKKIKIIAMADGSSFDPNAFYSVCLNSYRANGGGYLLEKGCGLSSEDISKRKVNISEKEIRWLIYEWLAAKGSYTPVQFNNVTFYPQERYKKLMEKDYLLLFGEND